MAAQSEKWHPGRLMEVSGGYWQTMALHTGVKLDVFTVIGEKKCTAGTIARQIKADTRGVSTLLDALCAMGLLEKTGDDYANSAEARTLLCRSSEQYMGHIILHHHHLVESWSRLDEAVISGGPVKLESRHSDAQCREHFLMGMFNIAMNMAPVMASKIDVSGRSHLLDLGGGPGTYAIHFCLKNPRLKATIFDLPTTRPFAEQTIEKFGLGEKIDFLAGDYLADPIEGCYDAAWMSHILHGEGPGSCRRILEKTVAALKPGGAVIIHEFILNDTKDGPLFPALFSLNMLSRTQRGRSYCEGELRDMLTAAGVKDIERIPVESPNDSGIIAGVV